MGVNAPTVTVLVARSMPGDACCAPARPGKAAEAATALLERKVLLRMVGSWRSGCRLARLENAFYMVDHVWQYWGLSQASEGNLRGWFGQCLVYSYRMHSFRSHARA